VLLSSGASLAPALVGELARLRPTQVLIVGGTAAVPVGIEQSLAATAPVRRIAGLDRYATADAVAVAMEVPTGTPVWLANGRDPADALGAASMAAAGRGVLLLTAPDALPSATLSALRRLQPSRVVIAGGTTAVSDAVATAVGTVAGSVTRAAGADRYGTAVALAGERPTGVAVAYVVSGTSWPDAVSASWAAGSVGAPLLLTDRVALPPATSAALSRYAPQRVVIVGGTSAVAVDDALRPLVR
jgi:putative cell wall-binding protein